MLIISMMSQGAAVGSGDWPPAGRRAGPRKGDKMATLWLFCH